MTTLTGRVALVTGGGRGIGRGAAAALAQGGAAVALLARSAAEVNAAADEINAAGGQAFPLAVDLLDPAALDAALAQVVADIGPIDILVNNAGVLGPLGPAATTDPDAWSDAITINLTAAYRCLRAVLPGMLERGWGRVINVSSGAVPHVSMPNASAYLVSKAGLDMLTRVVALEIAGSGVTVNAVYPGITDTYMQTRLREDPVEQVGADMQARFRALHQQGQLLPPAEPGRLIAAIALSDIHGQIVDIYAEQGQELLRGLAAGG